MDFVACDNVALPLKKPFQRQHFLNFKIGTSFDLSKHGARLEQNTRKCEIACKVGKSTTGNRDICIFTGRPISNFTDHL